MAEFKINNNVLLKCIVNPGEIAVTIPDSVTSMDTLAFAYCPGLTQVTIPGSVTSIGNGAFWSCSGLTSVTIPDSVTSIGDLVFDQCSGLTQVTIPDSVTSIGAGAFKGCSGLTQVTIPGSVTSIGYEAFGSCTGLTSVTILNSVASIGNSAFKGCTGLTQITIPGSMTSIGEEAFGDCKGLTSIEIPNSVTSIGEGALEGCSGLKSLCIPGCIAFSALQKSFWIWDYEDEEYVAPNALDTLPKAGFQLIREAVSIDLSKKVAQSGNIYAKRFCALLLFIQRRIEVIIASRQQLVPHDMPGNTLPHLPPEMWTVIACFYYQEYFPKRDITTTQIGLDEDELIGSYENQDAAVTSYNTAMDKLKQDWSTRVLHMK
ncbi:leucine-rich repeat domain-containing protein [Candidatus Synchoanobacter obligatus]|uniref:Leucine-rich repeat domain-containing protein n=1 Tax=Candidatus Synchoanobacter obligatus TaxID=2919597 RepID=A0ABT1L676_9GAMM|nr:leucine-rich repeat domain-containing protein [Candidatus Synchoanobacter obligatus]MCP8352674.1 leucine-rich repeat domain-containing protein [Candidatus Synchoanobacter obligatus]